jgi:hypothetical protein
MVLLNWVVRFFGGRGIEVQPKRIADERTPLLQEQPRVEVPSPDSAASEASSSTQPRGSGVSFDVGSGETTILFQAAHQGSAFDVPIQLNRQNVDANVQKLDGRLFTVQFTSTTGGTLSIG